MTIQRYSLPSGSSMQPSVSGYWVTITDHEADKARAVKEVTTELVALLARPMIFQGMSMDGYYHVRKHTMDHADCDRLVQLGAWECQPSIGDFVRYRPIEPRDSGESDD